MQRQFSMASVVVELNQQKSDSSLASKSTKPHSPMGMLPQIDPSDDPIDEVTGKCNHFSIRGYVSEVRNKDPKLCCPFSLKDSSEPLSMELPPMTVPKFRWWQCVSCVPEAAFYRGANNKEAQKPAEENADAPLPDLVGQSSKVNVSEVRNVETSISIDSDDNKTHPPFNCIADPKGKGKVHVEDEPVLPSALEIGFFKNLSQEIPQQTTGGIEARLAAGNEAVELRSRSNGDGIMQELWKDSRVDEIEARPAQENVNLNGESANENCREKPQASSEDRRADLPSNNMGAEVLGLNGPSNDRKIRAVNLPDLNECSGEPLCDESNEAMITNSSNDVFCEDDDDYLGAERRKNPKVRLLSELLGVKETRISAKGKRKNPSLTSSLDENTKRKKVGSQDEGSKSMEIRVLNNGTKKITGTTDISKTESEYASDSDDVSTEIISKALAKRRCKSKIPLLEKKIKKSKFDNGGSSISRQKIVSRSAGHEKGKSSEIRKNEVSDQLIERSSVLTKKRGRVLQSRKEAVSFNSCKYQTSKDFAPTQQDEDADNNTPAQKVQKASENVHHFPTSYVVNRNCQVRTPGEDRLCIPSFQAEPMVGESSCLGKSQDNRNSDGETSVAFRTSADATPFAKNPFEGNIEKSSGANTKMMEKQVGIPEAGKGNPLAQDMRSQVSNSTVNQKVLRLPTTEVRGRVHDIDINSIPVDDKITEQGSADDIPMDIVELMAKNQYERHLGDPKEKQNNPSTPSISGRYFRDNGNVSYGEPWQKLRQPHFLSMQKPQFTDPRNCMSNGNLGQFSDFNRNTVRNVLPRDNPVSARFLSLSPGQEHSPQYPTCDLSLNSWNGTINAAAPQRYPPDFFLLRTSAPRPITTDVSHAWPSVAASRMPLGITNLQMSHSSNALNTGKLHHQASGSILNFNSSGSTSIGKQQNLNFSNGYNVGGQAESCGGSADTYTNDAISAMHLLSLMQNAALSLGPQKVVRPNSSRPPFTENSRPQVMQDNSRHPCYPNAIPFASSYQRDGGNIARNCNTGFAGAIPLTLRGQRNIESSHFALQSGGEHQPLKRQMVSSMDKGKAIASPSHSSYVNRLQGMKDAAVPNFLPGRSVRRQERIILHTPEKVVCVLNQNPSEFNDPKVVNRYLIGSNDLRPRQGMSRVKSPTPRGDAKNRSTPPLPPSGKDRERQRKF